MLWLRWSMRDLRARWLQVAAIAFIIAIGTGLYSGLSSTSEWRKVSYGESFRSLHMYDLRAALSSGSYVDATELVGLTGSIPHAADVRAAEARLVVPTQVDASTDDSTILVPGRIVGVDVSDGGPHVNGIDATAGRGLRAGDAGLDRGVLETHFAEHYRLPSRGSVTVSGGHSIDYVGQALSPEYFLVSGERGNILAEANFAVLFVPLATAQAMSGHPGEANELLVTLEPGADRDQVEAELERAFADAFPDVGVTFNGRRGDLTYRVLYDDIEGDQRFYNIFAVLILAGAAFAAFNLTGRIVEAQRREIGIGMALGLSGRRLAIRPLLVGAEVAALGVVFGIGVGLLVGVGMGSILESQFPLPVWEFPFQPAVFARAAALGFVIPLVATAIPVWRAVRMAPVDAIRTGFLATKGNGLAPLLARLPLPGRSTVQMPFRNVLRAPRRTLMTLLGIAAAITVLIGVIGMVDSFFETIDRGEAETGKDTPDRLVVQLDSFYPGDAAPVQGVEGSPAVGEAEANLELPARISAGGTSVDGFVELLDLDSPIWHPTMDGAVARSGPGIVITATAAEDLGVEPGDEVVLRHPRRTGPASYSFVRSRVPVLATTPLPLRGIAYMDLDDAGLMGLSGVTNSVVVVPAPGFTSDEVKRALFASPGVASVQPVLAFTRTIRDQLEESLGVLRIVEVAVLLLALLIAFNSASINADERAREEATMFAFGLRVRTVLRIGTVESMLIGIAGTVVGMLAGWLLLDWLVTSLLPETFPDLGIVTAVSTRTWATAVVLGVVAVTVAPLLTVRKLRRMDVPATLRVME
jgi:putative ABC transport system permease protein